MGDKKVNNTVKEPVKKKPPSTVGTAVKASFHPSGKGQDIFSRTRKAREEKYGL